jgi:Cu(I)/Ag(I) efflux system membrane fusion protein
MNKPLIVAGLGIVLVAGAAGVWLARQHADEPGHRHTLVRSATPAGQVYYTCPMHPQVRQDQPGNCPICGMALVRRQDAATPAAATAAGERKPLYWYDPMKPELHFDRPGKSPFMDMELVPKYSEAQYSEAQHPEAQDNGQAGVVQIDPRMAQNLGMRTAAVRSGSFWQRIDAVGSVAIDERRTVAVEARAAGWIERLEVRTVGERVRRGQVLAAIYAPELLAAQEEYALARRLGDAELIEAARSRLSLLGGSPSAGAPQRRVALTAPQDGVVTELLVREGEQVMPGKPLLRLADLSVVWINVEVPEAQAGWIAEGRPAAARLQSLPGQLFEGRVDYVYPILDPQTRTLRARLAFDNPRGEFKPGMFAEVALFGGPRRDVTLVPTEAVIRTGARSLVIVAEAAGRYRPVAVTLGPERDGETVVSSGLQPGQRVVVSGQFLIDSEASLLGLHQRLGGAPMDAGAGSDAGAMP